MGLIRQPFRFRHYSSSFGAGPATYGTAFTAGTNGALGSAVSVMTLTHDAHLLTVHIGATVAPSGVVGTMLADILVDPAGGTNWSSLISYLAAGNCALLATGSIPVMYTAVWAFPLFIRSGSALGVRGRGGHSVARGQRVLLQAWGEPSRPDAWWCGQRVETLGYTSGANGTSVTVASTNTPGAWASIGVTTAAWGAMASSVQPTTDSSLATGEQRIDLGIGDALLSGHPPMLLFTSSSEDASRMASVCPMFCAVPAGATLQARQFRTDASEVPTDVLLHGVI